LSEQEIIAIAAAKLTAQTRNLAVFGCGRIDGLLDDNCRLIVGSRCVRHRVQAVVLVRSGDQDPGPDGKRCHTVAIHHKLCSVLCADSSHLVCLGDAVAGEDHVVPFPPGDNVWEGVAGQKVCGSRADDRLDPVEASALRSSVGVDLDARCPVPQRKRAGICVSRTNRDGGSAVGGVVQGIVRAAATVDGAFQRDEVFELEGIVLRSTDKIDCRPRFRQQHEGVGGLRVGDRHLRVRRIVLGDDETEFRRDGREVEIDRGAGLGRDRKGPISVWSRVKDVGPAVPDVDGVNGVAERELLDIIARSGLRIVVPYRDVATARQASEKETPLRRLRFANVDREICPHVP